MDRFSKIFILFPQLSHIQKPESFLFLPSSPKNIDCGQGGEAEGDFSWECESLTEKKNFFWIGSFQMQNAHFLFLISHFCYYWK